MSVSRVCLLVSLLCLISTMSIGVCARDLTLKLAYSHQDNFDSEIHTAAWTFAQELANAASPITVELYPNSTLGSERTVYEAMMFGAGAHCTITGTAILNNFNRKIGVLDMPYLWRSYQHVHRVLDGPVGEELARELRALGFEVLAWLDSWGFRQVVTRSEGTDSLAKLKGAKIRTIPSSNYVKSVNALGASATPMSFSEVYTAMETGVLDGLEHTPSTILSNRLYEIAHSLLRTNHLYGPLVFACSRATWSKLDESQRGAIRNAAHTARDRLRELGPEKEASAIAALREKGMQTYQVDVSSIEQPMRRLRQKIARGINATKLLRQIELAADD